MVSNCHGWDVPFLCDGCVRSDESLYTARKKHLRVSVQKLLVMPVDYRQKEEIVLPQIFFNTADDHRSIRVANLLSDNSNGIGALQAKGAGKIIGPVIQFLGGRQDPLLGACGDGSRCGGIIKCCGNC